MAETFNPTVLLARQRVRERVARAKAERALARLGAPAREDRAPRVKRRKMAPLSAEQRAAAYKAKRGPLATATQHAPCSDRSNPIGWRGLCVSCRMETSG
jgi:hypothetical protein